MIKRMLIAILLGYLVSSAAQASSVSYEVVKSGRIAAHVVTVSLADPETRVTVALARGGVGKGESFKSIVKRSRPVAAITGTFYDTKTMIPTGDIAVFGTVVHTGDFKFDYTPVRGGQPGFARLGELGAQGVLALFSDSTGAERAGYTLSEAVIEPAFDQIFRNAKGRIIVATFASLLSRVQQVFDAAQRYGRVVAVALVGDNFPSVG